MRILFLLLLPCLLFSEEAADLQADPAWLSVVLPILAALVAWGFKLLRSKWKVEEQHEALDATKSLWEQRNFLVDNRLIPFAMDTAEHWLLTQVPVLVRDATDGSGIDWGDRWDDLKAYTTRRILQKFKAENIDILQFLTERELGDLVNRLLMRLLGKLPDRITSILPEGLASSLTRSLGNFIAAKGQELLTSGD